MPATLTMPAATLLLEVVQLTHMLPVLLMLVLLPVVLMQVVKRPCACVLLLLPPPWHPAGCWLVP
jgi:hypothetical protein